MKVARVLVALIGVVVWQCPAEAQIYTWHDESGMLELSDRLRANSVHTVVATGARAVDDHDYEITGRFR